MKKIEKQFFDAIKKNDIKKFDELIEKGVDINAKDNAGNTPVHFAVIKGSLYCLRKLLKTEGLGEINIKDDNIDDIFRNILSKCQNKVSDIIQAQACANAKNNSGKTPVHCAAYFGRLYHLLELIKVKADINIKDNEGCTPVHFAAEGGSTICLIALISAGAALSKKNEYDQVPAHLAAINGHEDFINSLIAARADVTSQDANGYTPLDEARKCGHEGIVQLLNNYKD